jgi:uncharacterized membrane protein
VRPAPPTDPDHGAWYHDARRSSRINDDAIKQIGEQLQQGKSAVFVLARSATTDRVIEAIKPFNPTVIQTSLSHDREEELVRALQS